MDELMLFPLNTVLFPSETLSLHIFEPRYRTMVRICLREHKPFGIVLIRAGAEVGGPATPHEVGTEATILAWQELAEGRYNIVVQGGRRFEIVEQDHSHPFLVATVRTLPDEPGSERLAPEERASLLASMAGPFDGALPSGRHPDVEALGDLGDAELTFAAAAALPVPPARKQAILEIRTAAGRASQIVAAVHALEAAPTGASAV